MNQKPVDDKDVEDLIELFIERQNIGYDEETNVDNLAKDLETHYQKKYLGLLPKKRIELDSGDLFAVGYNQALDEVHQLLEEVSNGK